MKRLLNPSTNGNGIISVLALLAAGAIMIWKPHWAGPVSPAALVAILSAFANGSTRGTVTPIADPRIPGKLITDLQNPTMNDVAALAHLLGSEIHVAAHPLQESQPAQEEPPPVGTANQ